MLATMASKDVAKLSVFRVASVCLATLTESLLSSSAAERASPFRRRCGPLQPGPEPTVPPVANVLAIDVGGTKMAAARVDERGRLTDRIQVATPSGDGVGSEELWSALAGLVKPVFAVGDVVACG